MLSSGIIDLAIGIIFVFGVTAAVASVATEAISRFLGLRGAYLLLGLRELVDSKNTVVNLGTVSDDFSQAQALIQGESLPPGSPGPSATGALLGSPILGNQGMPGQISSRPLTLSPAADNKNEHAPLPKSPEGSTLRLRRSLPSYIPARSFAEAVIDLVLPDAAGQTSMITIQGAISKMPDSMSTLRTSLAALAASANGDVTRFRSSVENWYDDHMARVSGWYKRRVAIITLVVGAILVVLLNINTITIGRALYSDSTIRSAVSAVAAKGVNCPQDQPSCLGNLEDRLTAAAQAGLPIGWGTVADCAGPSAKCNWWEQRGIIGPQGNPVWAVILTLLGFLITIAAIAPGAQFWFGLLVKVNALRSSGTPPATSAS